MCEIIHKSSSFVDKLHEVVKWSAWMAHRIFMLSLMASMDISFRFYNCGKIVGKPSSQDSDGAAHLYACTFPLAV